MNYNASMLVLWTGLEQCCVIIVGCVPVLRRLFKLDLNLISIGSSISRLVRRNKYRQSLRDEKSDNTFETDPRSRMSDKKWESLEGYRLDCI
jgi:hypothetical protein